MKKNYIAPVTEIVNLDAQVEVMTQVNPFSDTTTTYDGNESTVEMEEEDWVNTSKSLWD